MGGEAPALITVTKEINVPRLPSIAGLRYAAGHPVTTWSAADFPGMDKERIGLQGSATQVKRTFVPKQEIITRMIGGSPDQQARRTGRASWPGSTLSEKRYHLMISIIAENV